VNTARKPVQIFGTDETTLDMALLGPRIGKKKKDPVNRRVGKHVKQEPSVVVEDPHILEILTVEMIEQARYAVQKRLTSDKPCLGVRLGLCGKVLSATKAYFDPNRRIFSLLKEGMRRQRPSAVERDAQLRQKFLYQRSFARVQRTAFAAAKKTRCIARVGRVHRFHYNPIGSLNQKAPPYGGAFRLDFFGQLYAAAKMASSKIATMLMILIIGLMAGPAVSLYGSPTVSPVTAALCGSEPLPP